MKTILSLLFLTTLSLAAQTNDVARPDADAVYLWVRNANTAVTALQKLDTALGYPNQATLTYRALDCWLLSNGTNALVRIDMDAIYSAKLGRYVNLKAALKEQIATLDLDELCTNATQLVGRPVARVSGSLARQIGAFLSRTNAVQPGEK
jgi:hypothetical protein